MSANPTITDRFLATSVALALLAAAPALAGERPELPNQASADWWSQVQADIAAEEYQVTWQPHTVLPDLDSAWQAPNRAQGFRTYFTGEGIRLVPRSADAPSWEWGLIPMAWGRPDRMTKVGAAIPSIDGNRVEYRREGIVEWYVNEPRGLEQGFAIPKPPAQEGTELAIDLALGGSLLPRLSEDGQAVDFYSNGNVNVLHYAELVVTDDLGQRLNSRFVPIPGGIRIRVEDTGARYPIEVDPLATNPAWRSESDQADALFGYSVATAGDVNGDGFSDVIVGAYSYDNGETDEGRAYVFMGTASGLSPGAAWIVEPDKAGSRFGRAVATAGDVNGDGYSDVIVGAPYYGTVWAWEGRAFVYLGSAAGLAQSPAWQYGIIDYGTFFASSVSTAGDVNGDGYSDVIIGATDYENGEIQEGGAFLFLGSAGGPQPTPAWSTESNQTAAYMGNSVSTAGDVNGDGYSDVVVGAYLFTNGESDEGRAYLYLGSAAGLSSTAAWTAEGNQVSAFFGESVSTAGDVNGDGYADVVVGARWFDNGEVNEGMASLYLGSPTGLSPVADWSTEGNLADADFGRSVATAGDVDGDGYSDVLVGASGYANGETDEGRSYLYLGGATGLSTTAIWSAEGNQVDARLGWSVATAGDVNGDGFSDVIVGAGWYDNGESDEGAAYLYLGSSSGPQETASWIAESDQTSAAFGVSASSAGDVNGDGYSDVIVGADHYDNGEADEGRAWVYLGSSTGLSGTASWTAESDQAGAYFGYRSGTAGDVNGDGYSDVIVGAYGYSNVEAGEGRVYAYLGSPSGLSSYPAWTAESDQASASFGYMLGTAGDVNGDGYSDVIVGAPFHDNVEANEGRAFVYLGSAAGPGSSPAWTAESDQASAWFGYSVGTAGDVNGDGYSDVVVGAPYFDNGQSDEGHAFIYLGSATGLSGTAAWGAEPDQISASFGQSVGTAGDVNGDGYSDVIVGARGYDNGQSNEGRAFVYLGSPAGPSGSPMWTAESDQASAFFGQSVATAGDVNGDGFSDVIVGAYLYDNGESNEGRAFVYLGSPSGPSNAAAWTAEGDQANAHLGIAVGTAGDINGDGFSDTIVGAPAYDGGETDEGRVFIHLGNDGGGLTFLPRQLRSDALTPIAPLGLAYDEQFRIGLTLRTPTRFGRARLQWQAVPLHVPFNLPLSPIQSSPFWLDTSNLGYAVNQLVDLSSYLGPWTWRARVQYHPGSSPFLHHGRWMTLSANGLREKDLQSSRGSAPPPCELPDEPVWIYQVTASVPQGFPILHFQDPNQPSQRTGYHVRRSDDPAPPKDSWPLVATNVVDMDESTPNIQWVDTSGDVSPTGNWYYQVTAYNASCPAEGPF